MAKADYNSWALRKPPMNVKVMIIFEDGSRAIGYRDTFGYVHKEDGSIVGEHLNRPSRWKKIERNEWGDLEW